MDNFIDFLVNWLQGVEINFEKVTFPAGKLRKILQTCVAGNNCNKIVC